MTTLDGPRLQPRAGGPARDLVILLHGYGSNGADLIALAPAMQGALPDALFVAPDAPERCYGAPGGYQWWALADLAPAGLAAGASAAAAVLDRFVDGELDRLGLAEDRLLLVGFSQGTMMALHVALRRTRPVAGVLGYSGLLADAGSLVAEIAARPPVLLVHGDADPVVPLRAMEGSAATLRALGVPVTTFVSRGLGHSVDEAGLTAGIRFAAEVLR